MLKIVLGYTGYNRDADCVCLYNGHSGKEAADAIAEAKEAECDIVRVEIFSNPVPTKRRTLVPREQDEPAADQKNLERLNAVGGAAAEKVNILNNNKTSDSKESNTDESTAPANDSSPGTDPGAVGKDTSESKPPAPGDQPELPAAADKAPVAKQAAKKAATKPGEQK